VPATGVRSERNSLFGVCSRVKSVSGNAHLGLAHSIRYEKAEREGIDYGDNFSLFVSLDI